MGGEPPGVSKIVKMIENDFTEFKGNNWAKIEHLQPGVEHLSGGKPI
jgi:hypothetical protein